jgi:hypothetical protein
MKKYRGFGRLATRSRRKTNKHLYPAGTLSRSDLSEDGEILYLGEVFFYFVFPRNTKIYKNFVLNFDV